MEEEFADASQQVSNPIEALTIENEQLRQQVAKQALLITQYEGNIERIADYAEELKGYIKRLKKDLAKTRVKLAEKTESILERVLYGVRETIEIYKETKNLEIIEALFQYVTAKGNSNKSPFLKFTFKEYSEPYKENIPELYNKKNKNSKRKSKYEIVERASKKTKLNFFLS